MHSPVYTDQMLISVHMQAWSCVLSCNVMPFFIHVPSSYSKSQACNLPQGVSLRESEAELIGQWCMQGAAEGKQVEARVGAAVAYHLLTACTAHKQTDTAAWLANLPSSLCHTAAPQPAIEVMTSTPCNAFVLCTTHAD